MRERYAEALRARGMSLATLVMDEIASRPGGDDPVASRKRVTANGVVRVASD